MIAVALVAWVVAGLVVALAVGSAVRIADARRDRPAPAEDLVVLSTLAG